jgi:hypothetical protein
MTKGFRDGRRADVLDRPRRREAALEKEVRHPPHVCFARDVLGVLEN